MQSKADPSWVWSAISKLKAGCVFGGRGASARVPYGLQLLLRGDRLAFIGGDPLCLCVANLGASFRDLCPPLLGVCDRARRQDCHQGGRGVVLNEGIGRGHSRKRASRRSSRCFEPPASWDTSGWWRKEWARCEDSVALRAGDVVCRLGGGGDLILPCATAAGLCERRRGVLVTPMFDVGEKDISLASLDLERGASCCLAMAFACTVEKRRGFQFRSFLQERTGSRLDL